MQQLPLDFQERVIYSLRTLYNNSGYAQYKMGKFEEYDLYARNKDFLISDGVITFMDTNGHLMALKPDVTLSIIKNTPESSELRKLYYTENVYRVSRGSGTFRELAQVGLECLGSIDDFAIAEVLTLAAESLRCISAESILDISHLGIVTALIKALGIPESCREELLKRIGEKNSHELAALCRGCGVEEERIAVLHELLALSGAPERVLPRVRALVADRIGTECVDQLERITAVLRENGCGDLLRIDFSAVDDIHYYNGIVFKGFIRSLPDSVLAGGQYDKLMRKMGRRSGAIGFAVYMDALERLEQVRRDYDVDVLLLYNESSSLMEIAAARRSILEGGESVLVQRSVPANIRFRRLCEVGK